MFVPDLCKESLSEIMRYAGIPEPAARSLIESMTARTQHGIGYHNDTTATSYYLGDRITREEIEEVQQFMQDKGTESENTRVRKKIQDGNAVYQVLQASSESPGQKPTTTGRHPGSKVRIVRGDHQREMSSICKHLKSAKTYAQSIDRELMLDYYILSLEQGSLTAYRQGQEFWVKDVSPSIEHILGFVESYRDPHGARAEWEGVVCIANPEETKKMEALKASAGRFCTSLPWATAENAGKGLFEKDVVVIPHCAIVHVCCPYVWEASNLPNYNDIRENHGSKDIIIANRMSANRNSPGASIYLQPSDRDLYRQDLHTIRFVATVIHELLSHSTGKLLSETAPDIFNFDVTNPPIDPLTGQEVAS
ncbi:hypothetical protein J4E91_004242 [Alternaria rosae]|nr:hypothetical protein J4E91_004242 [Alternaria rosae]